MTRIAAIDVGNDSVKAIFGELEYELNIPNVIARDVEERPIIGIEDLNQKDPLEGIHVKINSPALRENKIIYRVGHLATKSNYAQEVEPASNKSELDQTIVMLLSTLALDAVKEENAAIFPSNQGVIHAEYILGTGLPLKEVKEGRDVDYRKKLLECEHQVKFLMTPKYQDLEVKLTIKAAKVYPEGFAAYINLVMNNDLKVINKHLIDRRLLIHDIGGISTDIAVIHNRHVDDDKAQGYHLGVSEALDAIMDEIKYRHGVELDSRQDLIEIITREHNRNYLMVKGTRTSIHDIIDRYLLDLAKKQYRLLRQVWQQNSQTEICYFIGGGSYVLKNYLIALNKELDGFNIAFADSDKESIWMMANAYYKLISDFSRKTEKKKAKEKRSDKTKVKVKE